MSVYLSVCSGYNFSIASHRNLMFCMKAYLDHIWVMFQYQGHLGKAKVMWEKIIYLFQLVILCMWLQVIIKVNVTHHGQCPGQINVKVIWKSLLRRGDLMWVVCMWIKCVHVIETVHIAARVIFKRYICRRVEFILYYLYYIPINIKTLKHTCPWDWLQKRSLFP